MKSLNLKLFCAGMLAIGMNVHAAELNVVNPGFEASQIGTGLFSLGVPAGWSTYDPTGRLNMSYDSVGILNARGGTSFYPAGVPGGQNAALVFLGRNLTGAAGLQQTLVDVLQANTQYTLSVRVGNIGSGTSLPGAPDGGNVVYNLNGFPGYRIELLAGNTVLTQDNNSLGALIPEGQFMLSSLVLDSRTFPALIGQRLTIRLINLDLPGTQQLPGVEVNFDDVRLSTSAVGGCTLN